MAALSRMASGRYIGHTTDSHLRITRNESTLEYIHLDGTYQINKTTFEAMRYVVNQVADSVMGLNEIKSIEWENFFEITAKQISAIIQSSRNRNSTRIPILAYVSEVYVEVRWGWFIMAPFYRCFWRQFSSSLPFFRVTTSRTYSSRVSLQHYFMVWIDGLLKEMALDAETRSMDRETGHLLGKKARSMKVVLEANNVGILKLRRHDSV